MPSMTDFDREPLAFVKVRIVVVVPPAPTLAWEEVSVEVFLSSVTAGILEAARALASDHGVGRLGG